MVGADGDPQRHVQGEWHVGEDLEHPPAAEAQRVLGSSATIAETRLSSTPRAPGVRCETGTSVLTVSAVGSGSPVRLRSSRKAPATQARRTSLAVPPNASLIVLMSSSARTPIHWGCRDRGRLSDCVVGVPARPRSEPTAAAIATAACAMALWVACDRCGGAEVRKRVEGLSERLVMLLYGMSELAQRVGDHACG